MRDKSKQLTKAEEKALKKKLEDRYEMLTKKRAERMERERPLRERADLIFSAPRVIMTDFWCDVCKEDCSGVGFRQVSMVRPLLPVAWFEGTCPVGHKLLRYITDKEVDPYYEQSMLLQQQRWEMQDDFLTPDNPRFKELYPRQYEELMKKKKEASRRHAKRNKKKI